LREQLLAWRDRLLASPGFQQGAARFPLTRPIARRRARALFDLTAGFVYSQVLSACVQLRLFERLSAGPVAVTVLAAEWQLPPEGAARLLAAAESLGLVESRGEACYGLGELGAAMLGNPAIAAMVAHHERLYQDLSDPVALLRQRGGTRLAAFWPYAGAGSRSTNPAQPEAAYSDLMAVSQHLIADDILAAFSFRRCHHLLDIGGGDGSFAAAVLRRRPGMRATVLDLGPVADRANDHFVRAGLSDRARAVAGDMLHDPLPTGADVASLVRVLHDHDDEQVLALLRAARAALPPTGRLLIAEPMAATPGAEPAGAAYFGIYLWAMGSGRPRTAAELGAMARRAGFTRCRELHTRQPLLVRVLVARP
jgi:demethylspheroidene O-methyltransferase